MKKKVTIQDIADALGISRNTVSKAINNTDGIAESTRQKILQKAVDMGYKQFSYVQSVFEAINQEAKKKEEPESPQKEVALLTPMLLSGSHFASIMLDRLHNELMKLGYRLNTYFVQKTDLEERKLPFSFQPETVNAIICIEMFDWDYDMMICGLDIPVLFIDGPVCRAGHSLPADQLYMDNTIELQRLLDGIIKAGHRRIGFIGDQYHCQSFYERYLAIIGMLLLHDLPVEKKFMIPFNDQLDIYRSLEALDELPDVFFCANDCIAYDSLQALRRLDVSVPDQVLLCGFDDSPESRMVMPSITTVHIHTQIIAYSATQLLISRIEEPSLDFRKVYTQTDLVLRESTGEIQLGD